MRKKENNYKHITVDQMTAEDTFYMVKLQNGYMYEFSLKFIKFEKGMMYGKVIGPIEPNNLPWIYINGELFEEGCIIKGRPSKCFLYQDSCYWFKKIGKTWGVSELFYK